jgi:hypothetical protein
MLTVSALDAVMAADVNLPRLAGKFFDDGLPSIA